MKLHMNRNSIGEMLEGNPQIETGIVESDIAETMKTALTDRECLCIQRIV